MAVEDVELDGAVAPRDRFRQPVRAGDVEAWRALVRGTSCRLALNVMPRDMDGEQYLRKAHALYQLGIDHLAFWDTPIVGSPASPVLRRSARSLRGRS